MFPLTPCCTNDALCKVSALNSVMWTRVHYRAELLLACLHASKAGARGGDRGHGSGCWSIINCMTVGLRVSLCSFNRKCPTVAWRPCPALATACIYQWPLHMRENQCRCARPGIFVVARGAMFGLHLQADSMPVCWGLAAAVLAPQPLHSALRCKPARSGAPSGLFCDLMSVYVRGLYLHDKAQLNHQMSYT